MGKRIIHPVRLGATIKDFGFTAVIETASAMNHERFRRRKAKKIRQAERGRAHIERCISRHNSMANENNRPPVENFEVASGLSIITKNRPPEAILGRDFSITIVGMQQYRLELAYESMLRNKEMSMNEEYEEQARELVRKIFKINELDLGKLVMNCHDEKEAASEMLKMDFREFDKLLALVRGRVTESYFRLFLDDYFKEPSSLIIPSIEYFYQQWNSRSNKYELRKSEIDFIIACEKQKFYDALGIMQKGHSALVNIA